MLRQLLRNMAKKFLKSQTIILSAEFPIIKNVLEMSRQSVGTNVGINKTEKAVLEILIRNPKKTAEEIAIEIESTAF